MTSGAYEPATDGQVSACVVEYDQSKATLTD